MERHEEFWDFTPIILDVVNEVGVPIDNVFSGCWQQRNWLNVPGPIYAGLTDTCLIGRLEAPNNVLYDENGQEFIFRQPRNRRELSQVVLAAAIDPFGGYACDGNEHWNSKLIRDWWSRKGDLVNWIGQQLKNPEFQTHADFVEQNQLRALQDFQDFVQTRLHDYLRAYIYFLENGRAPQEDGPLPWL
jgi:hypothetical protein